KISPPPFCSYAPRSRLSLRPLRPCREACKTRLAVQFCGEIFAFRVFRLFRGYLKFISSKSLDISHVSRISVVEFDRCLLPFVVLATFCSNENANINNVIPTKKTLTTLIPALEFSKCLNLNEPSNVLNENQKFRDQRYFHVTCSSVVVDPLVRGNSC